MNDFFKKQIEDLKALALPPGVTEIDGEHLAKIARVLNSFPPDIQGADFECLVNTMHTIVNGNEQGLTLIQYFRNKSKIDHDPRNLDLLWYVLETAKEDSSSDANINVTTTANESGLESPVTDSLSLGGTADASSDTTDGIAVSCSDPASTNMLSVFALNGMANELERTAVKQTAILGDIALAGQATVIYAPPNTGKTLIVLSLLCEAITAKRIGAKKVFVLNMDDNATGLIEKLHLAEEYGFNMLADGYLDFSAAKFMDTIQQMIDNGEASGTVVICDTLKKFTNLMDKTKASGFTRVIRQFVLKGGTVIAVAHTNKKAGANGKLVYGGTSDVVDDFDCAYVITPISTDTASSEKTVEFENIKRRGNVVTNAAYKYSTVYSQSYAALIASVEPVDLTQLEPIKQAEELRSDAEIIAAVSECIASGITTKMRLAGAVGGRTGISKKSAIQLIEKYTGTDVSVHKWKYSVRDRGAKCFTLLDIGLQ